MLTISMAVLGTLVSSLIQQSVLRTAGDEWAAFLGAFLEPHIQELQPGGILTPVQITALDQRFGSLGESLVAMKIWSTDGRLLYASGGRTGADERDPREVRTAVRGFNVVQLEESGEGGVPLIEVYAPLHHLQSRQILAVGELYEDASNLVNEVGTNRLVTWVAVGLTTVLMAGALYLIVRRGTKTIARQRAALGARVEEARQLAAQNDELRVAADAARLDASEANEQLLARIGSDLHDGPVQLFSLVALRLSAEASDDEDAALAAADRAGMVHIMGEALSELRNISAGLSLPEIGEIGLRETLQLAVFRHEDRTGTHVSSKWGELPPAASDAVKTCAGTAKYTVRADGGYDLVATIMIAPQPLILVEVRSSGTVEGDAVCGVVAKADFAAAKITMAGAPANATMDQAIKSQLVGS
ncbi:MAG: hypothetical protein EOP19_24235, partial [Hyphomicrobiales bacterium]